MSLLRHTLLALTAPRRLVPLVLVSVPLVTAQHSLSRDPLAMPLGVLMCLAFALLAPYLWRRLAAPAGRPGPHHLLGLLAYGLAGALLVALLAILIPRALGVGSTFLTGRESILVSLTLFWVGGWGLGRDIEFEAGLERERARAEALAREAERAQLLAIRGQLDPHFLFNTLNAISVLVRKQDTQGSIRMLMGLSDLLRLALETGDRQLVPLKQELDFAQRYLDIERVRFQDRMSVTTEIAPETLGATVPNLMLQPLVENAIKHGVSSRIEGGCVRVSVTRQGDHLLLGVENPIDDDAPARAGEGVGLENVRRRLAVFGSKDAHLEAVREPGRFRVTLTLPARLEESRI